MVPGYHTSALVEHDLASAGSLLRRIGYRALAVRLSLARLDPLADASLRTFQVGFLDSGIRGLTLVLDADGSYLIDPWRRESPGLVEKGVDNERQIEYLVAAVELAEELGGGIVSFSVGPQPQGWNIQDSLDRLADVLARVESATTSDSVKVAIRPRVGHLVDSVGTYERLLNWLGHQSRLQFAADVSVMVVGGELPIVDLLNRLGPRLCCVYLADIRSGEGVAKGKVVGCEPLIGTGQISVRRVVDGLKGVGFSGPVVLEPAGSYEAHPEMAIGLFEQVFLHCEKHRLGEEESAIW